MFTHSIIASLFYTLLYSRGSYPADLGASWGATMCMGLIFFHSGVESRRFVTLALSMMINGGSGDDQVAFNRVLSIGGIRWRNGEEVKQAKLDYENSSFVVAGDADMGHGQPPIKVALLPHHRFRRVCDGKQQHPTSTIVLHCFSRKDGDAKEEVLKENGVWFIKEKWKIAVEERRHAVAARGGHHGSSPSDSDSFSAWLVEALQEAGPGPNRSSEHGQRGRVEN